MENKDFYVECNVCKQVLRNHVGSTPCCGSIAYLLDENDKLTYNVVLYGMIKNKTGNYSGVLQLTINENNNKDS